MAGCAEQFYGYMRSGWDRHKYYSHSRETKKWKQPPILFSISAILPSLVYAQMLILWYFKLVEIAAKPLLLSPMYQFL